MTTIRTSFSAPLLALAMVLPVSADAGSFFDSTIGPIAKRNEFRIMGQQKVLGSDGLDNYLTSESLDSARHLPGLAIDFSNDFGVRTFRTGGRIAAHQSRIGAIDGSNSFARLTYWNMQYLIGSYLYDSTYVKWDINAAVGIGWASVEADKGTRLSRYHAGPTDLAFPARAWTSLSFGHTPVFLVVEGGYEWGRIAHFNNRTNPGPTEPDNFLLDGAFVGVGLGLSFGGEPIASTPPTKTTEPAVKKAKKNTQPSPTTQEPLESQESGE